MFLHLCLVLAQNWCICGNRSPETKKQTSHLPQYKVQVCGVVTGWQDITITEAQHNAEYELFMPSLTLLGVYCGNMGTGSDFGARCLC